jgi:GNAT superfamily N-acetyltransferase
VIREAVRADAEAIARVHVDSWRGAYRGLLPDEVLANLSVERRRRGWESFLGDDASRVLVAEEDGRIVGFASVGPCAEEPDAAELFAIYLDPGYWDRGLGRGLMERAVEAMSGLGHTEAILWVLAANERARRFYEAAGWRTDGGEKTEEIGEPVSEVRYRRPLPPPG